MSSAAITLPAWRRGTLAIALVGSLLMWASLPPLALGWLGWIAPMPWLVLVGMNELPGRRPYRAMYLAGLAFWLVVLYWLVLPLPFIKILFGLGLPNPLMAFLLFALAAYLAFYLPVFVGLSRVAMYRFSLPLWLAAPIVWTGLELARAHLLTGFLMASLAHSQVHWTAVIQISDIFGEYGVDFVVMLVAACITSALAIPIANPRPALTRRLTALLPAALVLAATLFYGHSRLNQSLRTENKSSSHPRIALIQGNSLADWKADDDKQSQIMKEYVELSEKSIVEARKVGDGRTPNLIVWPETMYRNPLREFEAGFRVPTGVHITTDEITARSKRELIELVGHMGVPMLVGIDRIQFLAEGGTSPDMPAFHAFNSAALVVPNAEAISTYDKVHLVMFGEYVPFAHLVPILNRLSSLTGSVEAGAGPVALCTGGNCYIPSICYETVIPHVIRHQVATVEASNKHPAALINLTNDSWYWGSSELDMHLACGIFRAVETRLPLLIAANGGLTAWVDHVGHVRGETPRQQPNFLLADVEPSEMQSAYVRYGDWFAGVCLAFCVILSFIGWKLRSS